MSDLLIKLGCSAAALFVVYALLVGVIEHKFYKLRGDWRLLTPLYLMSAFIIIDGVFLVLNHLWGWL